MTDAPPPPEQAPDLISLSLWSGVLCHEHVGLGGRPLQTRLPPPAAPQVRQVHRGIEKVFAGLKRALRPLVRLIYLFPALLLVKLVLWVMKHPAGDYLTVGYVGLLVLFFTLLAALALLFPFVGPASKRQAFPALDLDGVDAAEAEALLLGRAGLEPTSPHRLTGLLQQVPGVPGSIALRLRGRLRRTDGAAGGPLLVDCWGEGEREVVRLCSGNAFALELEAGQPPLVVALQSPPLVVGRYSSEAADPGLPERQRAELGQWLLQRSEGSDLERVLESGHWLRLEEGQAVELIATRCEALPDVDAASVAGRRLRLAGAPDEAGAAPYRQDGGRRGLLITCTPEDRVLLRVL